MLYGLRKLQQTVYMEKKWSFLLSFKIMLNNSSLADTIHIDLMCLLNKKFFTL